MKRTYIVLLLILYTSRLFCSGCPIVFAQQKDITAAEYEVYSTVIQAMFVKEKVKIIVIAKQTTFYNYKSILRMPEDDYTRVMLEQLKPLSIDTIEGLEKSNLNQSELEAKLNLTVDYVLLGKQAPTNTPEAYAEQWRSFYVKYPGSPGIISLSRVGFNGDRNQALVYVANSCEGLCGKGYYVLLVKDGGGWRIEKDLMLWVS
jgi:hypothetical protein